MPPKKRSAKAPAKAKKQVKKQPAKPAKKPAKKPATKAPKKEDARSNCCYIVTSKDSVAIEFPEGWEGEEMERLNCFGPAPTLERGCRNGVWDIALRDHAWGEYSKTMPVYTHQSTERLAFATREDAVAAAYRRLVWRVDCYSNNTMSGFGSEPVLQQFPDGYFEFDGDEEEEPDRHDYAHRGVYPVGRDVVTTEPETLTDVDEQFPAPKLETVHKWTKQYIFTDEKGESCECEAKFSTTVTSQFLLPPGEIDWDEIRDDPQLRYGVPRFYMGKNPHMPRGPGYADRDDCPWDDDHVAQVKSGQGDIVVMLARVEAIRRRRANGGDDDEDDWDDDEDDSDDDEA